MVHWWEWWRPAAERSWEEEAWLGAGCWALLEAAAGLAAAAAAGR